MAQQLRVHDEVLNNASQRLLSAGLVVEQARITLIAGLDALDGCWGESDEVAQQFVKDYVPARDAVLGGADEVSALLRMLGERVGYIAGGFATLERDNTTSGAR